MNAYQRFSSSLALNVHFHALLLDGVYTTSSPTSPPIFRSATRLTQSEVETVQRDVTRRIASVLRAFHIHADPYCDPSPIPGSEDSLPPFLRAASIQSRIALGPESGQPIARVIDPPNKGDNRADKPSAPALTCTRDGYSLHAATLIRKGDHALRERLCRYITRPPLAQGRLSITEDGNVLWKLRSPWRDGTSAFVFKPLAFIERLVAILPHPREHQLTYHGVFAPASPLRHLVVPAGRPRESLTHGSCSGRSRVKRSTWADLLARVFDVDVLRCPNCHSRRHLLTPITDPFVIRRILAHLGLPTRPPPLAPVREPSQPRLPWDV